jgi:SAM-dependent methyltransferase
MLRENSTLPNSNKDLYSGIEFATWLKQRELIPQEEYLIKKYLKPNLTTVEAGTNGGRILIGMQDLGFSALSGFDYVPELIHQAIEQDLERTIDFQVQDAINLDYQDFSFDQIIYLQQILCTIENPEDRLKAVQESYRILKPGGIGLFSVLSFEARNSQAIFSIYYKYLAILRKLRGDARNIQYSPWFKLGGRFNFGVITDRHPHTYWYRVTEIYELLKSVGFEMVSIGTDPQIGADSLKTTDIELLKEEISGNIYIVVSK